MLAPTYSSSLVIATPMSKHRPSPSSSALAWVSGTSRLTSAASSSSSQSSTLLVLLLIAHHRLLQLMPRASVSKEGASLSLPNPIAASGVYPRRVVLLQPTRCREHAPLPMEPLPW